MKKPVAAALVAGSLLTGVGVGAAFFGPGPAIAQSSSDPGSSSADPNSSGAPPSNEDGTHENNETTEQEAAEDAGKGRHCDGHGPGGPGGRMGGSNENGAHEGTESPERESQEDANNSAAPNSGSSPAAPNASGSTAG